MRLFAPTPKEYADSGGHGMVAATVVADRWVSTTCGYCSVGCGMQVGVRDTAAVDATGTERDAIAVASRGDPAHPVNRGCLCPKGLAEHHTIHAAGRLTQPLVRRDGRLEPATWDAALGEVAGRFRSLVAEHGPGSVAVLSTGQLVTEDFYTLGKLVRGGLGLSHFDGNTTLCMAAAVAGYKRSFGSDGPPGSYDDLAEADAILLVGANIAENHPILAPRLLDNSGAELIVVDPRVTKTAMLADQHLAIQPRTDVVLINGILKVLFDEGLVDVAATRARCDGLDELVEHVGAYDLHRVAETCGVAPEAVWRAAVTFGRARSAVVAWTMGVNHSSQGTETVNLLCNLALVTGNVGVAGGSALSITGQCNAMGTREAGATASLPGYRPWDDAAARTEIADLWGVPVERLPSERGWAYPDIVEGIIGGKVRALWVIGTNPVVSFPNRELVEDALGRLELLVVQDGFETPTTRRADVVLPAAIWGEKDGTYTNTERRVSRVRAVVAPPGEARTDFDIFLALAESLGLHDELFEGWVGPEDAFEEWRRVSAGRLCDYSGIDYDRIEANGGVQWPAPAGPAGAGVAPGGTPRLYADGRFGTDTGRAKLWCVTEAPIGEAVRPLFPLLLNTGRTVEHWHTRTKTGRVPVLEGLAPEAWVEVNPVDARSAGVDAGGWARLVSQRGAIDRIRVRVTETVRPGEVFVPFHFDEACANRLTINEFDPISREPNYKQCAVRLEPPGP